MTQKEVRYVAELANLSLTESEVQSMVKDLGAILEHMSRLSEIDTEGVEPLRQVLFPATDIATLRADVPGTCLSNAEALANARQAGHGYFKIPRVIER